MSRSRRASPPGGTARVRAVAVLRDVLERGARAAELLSERERGLSDADRGLLRELVLGVLRWKTALDGRLREIIIIRLGHLTHCHYVLRQHVPALALADGLTLAECNALADWEGSPFFSAGERAALGYADVMTRDIVVPDAVFAEVAAHFDSRQIVELTVLIGTYNMNARVLQALELDLEPAAR